MLGAIGVDAQRRGAFIAGPPYAGRPVAPAVAGTPGAALWNPGNGSAAQNWSGRGRWGDRDRTTQVIIAPVPVIAGEIPPDQPPGDPPPPVPEAPPPAAPAVTINTAPPPPEAPRSRCVQQQPDPVEPPYVLIALNNGWVYAALAYWVDGRTLHYVTAHGEHNQVSLELVDRKLSARLNRPSQIQFVLP